MEFLFWLSVLMIFYVYLGYPLSIAILSLFMRKDVKKKAHEPFVSILIAAYNEAEHIKETILNKLELDYPSEKLEIIVISDESTDGTDEVVSSFSDKNIRLIRQEPRAGKTAALNLAVPQAQGELIVFSDANSIYEQNALNKLVANFSDTEVGYASGKMIYVNSDGTPVGDGCSAYMKYENLLRKYETKVGSIVGVDGGIDAIRKDLYEPMNNDQLPDFVLPLKVAEKGYRVVYEPEALLKEDTLKHASDEYKMRVRVSLRAIWAIFDMCGLLFFQKGSRLFSWQLWSHKVLRYACFMFLITAYILNVALLSIGDFYILTFLIQSLAIIASILAVFTKRVDFIGKILNFCHYFVLLNIASGHASLKFIMGKKQVLWSPRKG